MQYNYLNSSEKSKVKQEPATSDDEGGKDFSQLDR